MYKSRRSGQAPLSRGGQLRGRRFPFSGRMFLQEGDPFFLKRFRPLQFLLFHGIHSFFRLCPLFLFQIHLRDQLFFRKSSLKSCKDQVIDPLAVPETELHFGRMYIYI